jgi:hypothetical protein
MCVYLHGGGVVWGFTLLCLEVTRRIFFHLDLGTPGALLQLESHRIPETMATSTAENIEVYL